MADYKVILTTTPDAASNTTNSSAFVLPGEAMDYVLQIPASTWNITATVNVRIMGAVEATGTYYRVGFATDPAVVTFTSTTSAFVLAETPVSAGVSGGFVVMEGLEYVKFGKLEFSHTATASTNFVILGRFKGV